jgi:hypothetical protein
MSDATPKNDVWRQLFRKLPDRPLPAILGEDRPAAGPPLAWSAVRAKAAHLLADSGGEVLVPPLAALRRLWAPDLAGELTSGPSRTRLREVFEWCRERLLTLPPDLVGAHAILDAVERNLQDCFITCGDRTAEVVLFAGSRTLVGSPADQTPTPEERRQAVLAFLGWVNACLAEGAE